jgi:hypothetical protein
MTPNYPPRTESTFQQFVDKAKRDIAAKCPDWTDHSPSDPGITLIELFASMFEAYLYRLRNVTDEHYLAFLKVLGVQREPGRPATGRVTFRLANPLTEGQEVTVPKNTFVGRSAPDAITYRTTGEVKAVMPRLAQVLLDTSPDADSVAATTDGPVAATPAQRTVLLGFSDELSNNSLLISLPLAGWPEEWRGSVLTRPEGRSDGSEWVELGAVNRNQEKLYVGSAPNNPPTEVIHLPPHCVASRQQDRAASTWIRYTTRLPVASPFDISTLDRSKVTVKTIAVTAGVEQANRSVAGRSRVGVSTGLPSQRYTFAPSGIVSPPRQPGWLTVIPPGTRPGDGGEPWELVDHFRASSAQARHAVLDAASGELTFGPFVNGIQYGAVPAPGSVIEVGPYEVLAGRDGNASPRTINKLFQTVPSVVGVQNHEAFGSGRDAESVDALRLRAPDVLRRRNVLVTPADYESQVAAVPGVGRVRCRRAVVAEMSAASTPSHGTQAQSDPPKGSGVVRLDLLPRVAPPDDDYVKRRRTTGGSANDKVAQGEAEFAFGPDLRSRVLDKLADNHPIGIQLEVSGLSIIWVKFDVRVELAEGYEGQDVLQRVARRLCEWCHPLVGWEEGHGWPFGAAVSLDDILAQIRNVPGVRYAFAPMLFRYEYKGNSWSPAAARVRTDGNTTTEYFDLIPLRPDEVACLLVLDVKEEKVNAGRTL